MEKITIQRIFNRVVAAIVAVPILLLSSSMALGSSGSKTYTVNADFDEGSLINVSHDVVPNQLQLIDQGEAFNFIWVAASGRGTIVKIDTETGDILGEYWSSPDGMGRNPSRTTVDANGNVWAGNRNEASGNRGSIVHIGLEENGQCVDRNGNGTIETSSGLGDILDWDNAGSADVNGGVSTAKDECIIHYVRTAGTYVRTVAVDGANNVWAGGYGNRVHELYDDNGLAVPGSLFTAACGGYGGLVDGNGVLWSANISQSRLLRYDPAGPVSTCIYVNQSYGLGIDSSGAIWNSMYSSNMVMKINPDGTIVGGFPKWTGGASNDRGVAVTPDDNVWVANSAGTDVSRLDNDGNVLTVVTVGSIPTGVAVDAAGKVWVTNYYSHNVMRIDPDTNLVDLTVSLGSGAYPYNYSDMTGSTLNAPPDSGTWTVDYDGGVANVPWQEISWNAYEPGDASIVVEVAGSDDGATFGPFETMSNGGDPSFDKQFIRIRVSFTRSTNADGDGDGIYDSPILYDLTVISDDEPPIASNLMVAPNPVAINAAITITANIDDTTTGNSNILSAYFTVDGGSPVAMFATDSAFDTPYEDVTASTSFVTAGVHTICVHGYDVIVADASNEVCALLAVYDPSAGFVTGGGWIDSPAGAYVPDPTLFGKATFGFVSKYKRGQSVPDGNTQFQFHAADMKFKSTAYDWLVIAGKRAQYKGIGVINGMGNYGFMLFGIDGDLTGGDGIDRFRIKIWDKDAGDVVVYDNEIGAADDAEASTALGGGSIVIHSK